MSDTKMKRSTSTNCNINPILNHINHTLKCRCLLELILHHYWCHLKNVSTRSGTVQCISQYWTSRGWSVVECHLPSNWIQKGLICTMREQFLFLYGKQECIFCWFLHWNPWHGWNELNPFSCIHRCKALENVGMPQDEFATCWNATAISHEQPGNCCAYPSLKKTKSSRSDPTPHT